MISLKQKYYLHSNIQIVRKILFYVAIVLIVKSNHLLR